MHAHGCLEPEVLAAYVDHGLSLVERARAEAHLASCPQCTALLAGVVRTVAELAPVLPDTVEPAEASPLVSRRAVAGVAVAAAAVFAVLSAPSFLTPRQGRDAGLVGLAGKVGERRSVLGRLTGGFPHAPLDAASAGGQDVSASGTDRVLLTAGRIRESVGEAATPSRLHSVGVSQLLERHYDAAADLLSAASRHQPANARYLNDVATVQLERARLGLRPDDLPRALAAADRARRLDPSLTEAWFNRALAMSALQLTDQARTAWTDYLQRDSASPWAGEARKRLEELSQPTPAMAWSQIERQLRKQIDSTSADAAVRAQTTEARNYIENTLVTAWADAVLSGGTGDRELDRVRVMAESMMRIAGDAMYVDAAAAMGGATGETRRRLARAHLAYARAAALFNQDDFTQAGKALPAARSELTSLNSPFGLLADVHVAAIDFVNGRYPEAEAAFAQTEAAASARNYLYAAARSTWFRGLIAFGQTRVADAQMLYEDTLATFDRMGDVEQSAAAHSLLAALNFSLGNKGAEWRHRAAALRGIRASISPRFRYSILASAAISVRYDNPEAALPMLEAALSEARHSGRDAAIVDAVAQRAAALNALGRNKEARSAIDQAREQLASMRDESFRRVLELPVLAVESDLVRTTDPQLAASLAQRGIDTVMSRPDRSRLPLFQLKLAKAHIASGHLDEAERALTAGIAAFDETRAKAAGATGIAASDESWQLYETAVQLAIHRGDHQRAFALAERGRMRNVGAIPVATLADAERAQPPDGAIVAINQFDDEVAIWVIRQGGTSVVRRPMNRVDAQQIVTRLQDETQLETRQPAAGALLFDEIIRPVAARLNGVARIVFVPDSAYQDVSIAALWDRTTERFAVEKWTLAQAPNVTMAAAARDTRTGKESILVLSPATADATASTIAGQYSRANIVVGADATQSRLLTDTSAVVHIAAAAQRNAIYPGWSQLRLSDEAGRKYSGTLIGRDIAARQMPNTSLVVLDELTADPSYRTAGTFDLATAFLAAGVPAVLGTLPGADERHTRELMVGFHRQLAMHVPAAEALAQVQRNTLQQNGRRLGAWTALVLYGSDR